jgi:hypothetical protein
VPIEGAAPQIRRIMRVQHGVFEGAHSTGPPLNAESALKSQGSVLTHPRWTRN